MLYNTIFLIINSLLLLNIALSRTTALDHSLYIDSSGISVNQAPPTMKWGDDQSRLMIIGFDDFS